MTVADKAANMAAGATNKATSGARRAAGFAFRNWEKVTVTALAIAATSLFMQPALAATVATNISTLPAATNLTGAVANTISATSSTLWTGLSHSGPVWSAAWGGLSSAGGAAYDFASSIPGLTK